MIAGTSNPIEAALGWLQSILLGSLATTIAVIAVASVGFLMLTGRLDLRRAAQVVIGCFIIFGASSIASGILATISAAPAADTVERSDFTPSPVPPPPDYPKTPPKAYDPYAGAAVPQ